MSGEARRISCPGCGMKIPVPRDAEEGDLIECENCAGVKFRLGKEGESDILRLVQLVSVPSSDERIPIDADTPEGTVIHHGGIDYELTKEFGAFGLKQLR